MSSRSIDDRSDEVHDGDDHAPRHLAARGRGLPTPPLTGPLPTWFAYLVVVSCAGVLAFGGFGLLLADIGHYSLGAALGLGAVGTVVATAICVPALRRITVAARGQTVPAAAMCGVALLVAIWNAVDAGHHVAVDRDPGVYTIAGRWLAGHSSLVVQGGAPWTTKSLPVNWGSVGMYPVPGGKLEFQFPHLLPALLAEAHGIGGDALLFRVPALLGALAVLCVYAVGCSLVRRPWLVAAAVSGLAVSLPELSVTRDTYSEPATQVLLWGGIWLLLRGFERRRVGPCLLAGAALGGTVMTRIDAVAYLLPLPLLAAVCWLGVSGRSERRRFAVRCGAVLVGLIPPTLLGTFDVQRRAGQYYDALAHQVHALYAGVLVAVVIGVVVVGAWPRLPAARRWLIGRRGGFATLVAWLLAVFLVLAWSIRPAGPKSSVSGNLIPVITSMQKAEDLHAGAQSYAEQSMRWIEWYIGPIALALAIAGLSYLVVRAIRNASAVAFVVLAMAGPLTLAYLWHPSITPEQVWAARRYVPASFPLLVIVAAVAADVGATAARSMLHDPAWPRRIGAAAAVGMVAFPLGVSLQVRDFQDQANYLPVVDRTCRVVGPKAAILFAPTDYDALVLPQTLRSWCGDPTGRLTGPVTAAALQAEARSFAAEGRTLWVAASTAAAVTAAAPGVSPALVASGTSSHQLEETLSRPPEGYAPTTLTVFVGQVPVQP